MTTEKKARTEKPIRPKPEIFVSEASLAEVSRALDALFCEWLESDAAGQYLHPEKAQKMLEIIGQVPANESGDNAFTAL